MAETKKVTKEVAEAEIKSWLDKKKILPSTRERYEEYIDLLIDAMCEGVITLNADTFVLTHTLMVPLEGEQALTELSYKSRMNDRMLKGYMTGVKSSDADGRLNAVVSALTSKPREIIAAIDSSDKKISMAIAVFFL